MVRLLLDQSITMPRIARIVIEGLPHHVTQRGNNRAEVFFGNSDREFYLRTLKEKAREHALDIIGYCLMPNHVHLVVIPKQSDSLALGIGRTHYLHSQRVNYHQDRIGHLWQGRFFSCPLGDTHYWNALAYTERNPVRAKLVNKPWEYPWSSAAAHVGEGGAGGLLDLDKWGKSSMSGQWKSFLLKSMDEEEIERLRMCTRQGRPWASDEFLDQLEKDLGHSVRAQSVGRPRKL